VLQLVGVAVGVGHESTLRALPHAQLEAAHRRPRGGRPAAALPAHDVLLLARHGALTLGATVAEAVDRMETLERVARIALAARAFGACTPLAPEVVDRVLAAAGRPPRGRR
jgi:ribulose-5-phosphate 4-epimerase/fuculose-1-phosphate aldolase